MNQQRLVLIDGKIENGFKFYLNGEYLGVIRPLMHITQRLKYVSIPVVGHDKRVTSIRTGIAHILKSVPAESDTSYDEEEGS